MMYRTDSAATYFDFLMYRTSTKRVRDTLTIPYRFGVGTLAWPLNKTWEHVLFNFPKNKIKNKEVNRLYVCFVLVITITNCLFTSLVTKLMFSAHQLTRS